jgi:hypothetical protein
MTAMKALDRHVGYRIHAILTHKNKVLEEPDVWLFPHILSLGETPVPVRVRRPAPPSIPIWRSLYSVRDRTHIARRSARRF